MTLRRFDYVAVAGSLAAFLLFLSFGISVAPEAEYVSIRSRDGEFLYNMAEDRVLAIEGPVGISEIVVGDGAVHFSHSDCDDHLCEATGLIEHGGQWAACLPNHVFVTVVGEERGEHRETDS